MGRGTGTAVALVVGTVEILDFRVSLIEMEVQVVSAISTDYGDGNVLYSEMNLDRDFETISNSVDITGVQKLTIVLYGTGNSRGIILADAKLLVD